MGFFCPTSPTAYFLGKLLPDRLLDFNEEEYATLPADDEGVDVAAAEGRDLAGVEGATVEGAKKD
ncbi:hypothetical protein Acr_00g0038160 [Actinidia rufa]|uniref:Uncharacterized protein n=1 Tax=Actinidia rufa TaxID=165716 RepID=A0A7J0DH76_9ERIC|nr:hypothetical protein Acr_00g0038160 [Actinidia rufa]